MPPSGETLRAFTDPSWRLVPRGHAAGGVVNRGDSVTRRAAYRGEVTTRIDGAAVGGDRNCIDAHARRWVPGSRRAGSAAQRSDIVTVRATYREEPTARIDGAAAGGDRYRIDSAGCVSGSRRWRYRQEFQRRRNLSPRNRGDVSSVAARRPRRSRRRRIPLNGGAAERTILPDPGSRLWRYRQEFPRRRNQSPRKSGDAVPWLSGQRPQRSRRRRIPLNRRSPRNAPYYLIRVPGGGATGRSSRAVAICLRANRGDAAPWLSSDPDEVAADVYR